MLALQVIVGLSVLAGIPTALYWFGRLLDFLLKGKARASDMPMIMLGIIGAIVPTIVVYFSWLIGSAILTSLGVK